MIGYILSYGCTKKIKESRGMKTMNLLQDEPKRLFAKYLFPSISATLVTSIYVLADTIMIGKGIGPSALAALNLILPVFTLLFGTGLLLGIGGSILMSVANGAGDKKMANTYFTNAVVCGAIFAVIYVIGGRSLLEPIGYLMGCTDNTIELFTSYGIYLVSFAPVFIFSSLLQAFVRNDNAPKTSMVAVISGGVTNIILDYIFIFHFNMGMPGGAIATVLGSTVTCLILFTHFFSQRNTMKIIKGAFKLDIFIKIMHSGFPSFLVEMASGIVTMLFNLQLLRYIGEIGVTVYGIIANTAIVAMSLFNGVAQGAQPIMAANFGAQQEGRVAVVRKLGAQAAFAIGLILFAAGFLFPEQIVKIFVDPTPEIMALAKPAIKMYFIAFILMSFNIFYSTYFQSVLQPKISMIICLLRGVIISSILVYLLPALIGINGIWIVIPLTELLTLFVTIICIKRTNNKNAAVEIE